MRRTITIWYKNVYPKPKNILFLFCYKYLLKVEMHKCLTLSSYYLFIYMNDYFTCMNYVYTPCACLVLAKTRRRYQMPWD